MTKYRIISNGSQYQVQRLTLWFFWVTLYREVHSGDGFYTVNYDSPDFNSYDDAVAFYKSLEWYTVGYFKP
jgi:hypothetical protein